jgi:hypothetical protein
LERRYIPAGSCARLTATRHVFRRTVFEGETTVVLSGDAIDVTGPNGATRRIALGDIARVRLWSQALRGVSDQYNCQVEPREGSALQIRSVSYRLFAYDDRAATWRPLIQSLHQRLARLDPPPQFVAGLSPIIYALHVGVCLAMIAFALVMLIANVILGLVALFLVGVLGAAYWWRHLKTNHPRPYDPLALPPALLPADQPSAP